MDMDNELLIIDNNQYYGEKSFDKVNEDDTDTSDPEKIKWDYVVVFNNFNKQAEKETDRKKNEDIKERKMLY